LRAVCRDRRAEQEPRCFHRARAFAVARCRRGAALFHLQRRGLLLGACAGRVVLRHS
jgi:hypothetical protein